MIFLPRWHDPAAKPRPPLFTVTGSIVAPVERISPALLAVPTGPLAREKLPPALRDLPVLNRGAAAAYEVVGGPTHFTALPVQPPQGHLIHIEVDLVRHAIAIQGGWWFRAEFRLEPAGDAPGSRLSYSVFNVAPGMSRFVVPLVYLGRRPKAAARATLARVLAGLSRELGVVTLPLA